MMVKQLSVFIENRPGRLYKITQLLSQHNIDLVMLSIADTKEFGILRIITSDIEKSFRVLKEAGYTVSITEMIGVEVPDRPGGLAEVLAVFDRCGISIEYLYSFARTSDKIAIILFRVEDSQSALEKLMEAKVKLTDRVL
ncbi:MAG: ACT domain-containing protein [Clostridiales bacterium]|nr:ACT domain-containing protein [Clostridiales bacterium]